MPDWFANGNAWTVDELAMLVQYRSVKLSHLTQLLPNHTEFDIARKQKELEDFRVTDLDKLQLILDLKEKIEW